MSKSKIAQDKLSLLYIVYKSNNSISYDQLANLVLEYDLINYFDYVKYIKELIESDFLDPDDDPYVKLTDFSIKSLDLLGDTMDPDLVKTIDSLFEPIKSKSPQEYSHIREKSPNEYIVSLYIDKEIDRNFVISYTLSSLEEAREISNFWDHYHDDVFLKIREILKGD